MPLEHVTVDRDLVRLGKIAVLGAFGKLEGRLDFGLHRVRQADSPLQPGAVPGGHRGDEGSFNPDVIADSHQDCIEHLLEVSAGQEPFFKLLDAAYLALVADIDQTAFEHRADNGDEPLQQ